MASSLSFWINFIIEETLDDLVKNYFVPNRMDCQNLSNSMSSTATYDDEYNIRPISRFDRSDFELPECMKNGTATIRNNIICVIWARAGCNTVGKAGDMFAICSWFYPFSIQFSILVVAIWYVLWSSIGKIGDHKDIELLPSNFQGSTKGLLKAEDHKKNIILFADCTSSVSGLFLGVPLVVFAIVSSIIVIANESNCDPDYGILLGNILKATVLVILIFTSALAYYILAQFDVNPRPISYLNDSLLFLCIPSFFCYGLLSLGCSFYGEYEPQCCLVNILTLIQILIQTPMIVDGLRRCSYSPDGQKEMKGRNVITFLIVANLAAYVMETVMIRSVDYQTKKIEMFGLNTWTIISHLTLPVCIFYRFHSAVALVDIWKSAYKAPE